MWGKRQLQEQVDRADELTTRVVALGDGVTASIEKAAAEREEIAEGRMRRLVGMFRDAQEAAVDGRHAVQRLLEGLVDQAAAIGQTLEDLSASMERVEAMQRTSLAGQLDIIGEDLNRIEGKVNTVLEHETLARNEQKVVRKRLPQTPPATMTGLPGPGRRVDTRAPEAALGSNGAAPMPKPPAAIIEPPLPVHVEPVKPLEPRPSYISVAQAALRHDVPEVKVKRAARAGDIVGAKKESNRVGWQLPSPAVDAWARNL